ncbi:MAG: Uma2 family endonuclease [Tildeniella nuda ZEHNDER 1965/U140]|jgi:Uma2 family endonuclease|nr:Uma2 family endonuclease [Tildeniella nuda ZEHNDER 1965/U140]
MTYTKLSFEDYLTLDACELECPAELIDGELIELPPEAGLNSSIVMFVVAHLLAIDVPFTHIKPYCCEVQTPVLERGDAANRYPDLVILSDEHLRLIEKRNTITLEMPPPRFVLEVVSPGQTNRHRDYVRKRAQYAAVGIPEYVIVDPEAQTLTVLVLEQNNYREAGCYSGDRRVLFPTFPELALTVTQISATS